ncbi:hypothetical protein Cus16_2938 [Curtobacterium sp. ER1/6]|nr:hypothetical protein Cus16_2938 [Curtobacterium sp. ER1/6]
MARGAARRRGTRRLPRRTRTGRGRRRLRVPAQRDLDRRHGPGRPGRGRRGRTDRRRRHERRRRCGVRRLRDGRLLLRPAEELRVGRRSLARAVLPRRARARGADRRERPVRAGVPVAQERRRQLPARPDAQHPRARDPAAARRPGRLDQRVRRPGMGGHPDADVVLHPVRLGRGLRLRDAVRDGPRSPVAGRRDHRPRRLDRRQGRGRDAPRERDRRHRAVPEARPQPAPGRDLHGDRPGRRREARPGDRPRRRRAARLTHQHDGREARCRLAPRLPSVVRQVRPGDPRSGAVALRVRLPRVEPVDLEVLVGVGRTDAGRPAAGAAGACRHGLLVGGVGVVLLGGVLLGGSVHVDPVELVVVRFPEVVLVVVEVVVVVGVVVVVVVGGVVVRLVVVRVLVVGFLVEVVVVALVVRLVVVALVALSGAVLRHPVGPGHPLRRDERPVARHELDLEHGGLVALDLRDRDRPAPAGVPGHAVREEDGDDPVALVDRADLLTDRRLGRDLEQRRARELRDVLHQASSWSATWRRIAARRSPFFG